MERIYTVSEAAEALRVTRATVYIWMRTGQLAYVIVGSHRRITQSAIDAFIKPANPQLAAA